MERQRRSASRLVGRLRAVGPGVAATIALLLPWPAVAAASQPPERPGPEVVAYLARAAQYRSGARDEAVAALKNWEPRRVENLVRQLPIALKDHQ